MATYQAINACTWRTDSGGRWIPHITDDIRQGTYDGIDSVGVMVFNLSAIRDQYATHSPTAARLRLTRTGSGAYGSARPAIVYAGNQSSIPPLGSDSSVSAPRPSRVTGPYSYTISAGQGDKTITISTALIDSIGNSTSNCLFIDAGTSTTNYMSFEGRGNLSNVVLEIDWTPREPAPSVPVPASIAKITTASKTFQWSDSSDSRGIFTPAQLYYDMQVSLNGGSSWGSTYTSSQGSSQYALNMQTYVGFSPGDDYYNTTCRIRVRSKTPSYNGTVYYSAWAQSSNFTVDYRITPATPSITAPGTITAASKKFQWSAVASPSGIFPAAQITYELQISTNGGSLWGNTQPNTQGNNQLSVNLKTYLDLQAAQYYYNTHLRIRVRARTPSYNGTVYYSAWAQSGNFVVDYRLAPSVPASLALSKANPYEGEAINFTVGRPGSYNTHNAAGGIMTLTYYVRRDTGAALANAAEPATSTSKAVPYTVGNLTSGKADLPTSINAYVTDAQGQTGPATSSVSFTVRRFRAPIVTINNIDRSTASATISITVTDTGFGASQVSGQINVIQYRIGTGSWLSAPIGSWSGLNNSFNISGLNPNNRYNLRVRAVNNAPAGTGLSNKTGSTYTATIPEYVPAMMVFRDTVTDVSGMGTKALIVGGDYAAPINEGDASIAGRLDIMGTPLSIESGGSGAATALAAAQNMQTYFLGEGIILTAGTNVDNLKTPGTYRCIDAATAAALTGTIPLSTAGFKLIVNYISSANFPKQIINYNGEFPYLYERTFDIQNNRWFDWILTNNATGILAVARGGTGAGTASVARSNLGLGTAATASTTSSVSSGSSSLLTSGGAYTALQAKANLTGASFTGAISSTVDGKKLLYLVTPRESYPEGLIQSTAAYGNTGATAANVYVTSAGTLGRYVASSRRYKNSITDAGDVDGLLLLPVREYKYNEGYVTDPDYDPHTVHIGFIAEEVAEYFPQAVQYNESGVPETWDVKKIVPGMLKLIQEQDQRIRALEAKQKEKDNQVASGGTI